MSKEVNQVKKALSVNTLVSGAKMAINDTAAGVKMAYNDTVKPVQDVVGNPLSGANFLSKNTGGSGDIITDAGDALGIPRGWKGGAPDAAPVAATPVMPDAIPDAEAIARARRLAALKGAGGGRQGTFLGGSGLGNG